MTVVFDHDIMLQDLNNAADLCCRWYCSSLMLVVFRLSNTVRKSPLALWSLITRLLCSVAQRSILEPLRFSLYTFYIIQLIEGLEWHRICSQWHTSQALMPPFQRWNGGLFLSPISNCLRVVFSWMRSNRLHWNSTKTEVEWCETSRRTVVRLCHDVVAGGWPGDVSVRPWYFHQCQPVYENTHTANCVMPHFALFDSFASYFRQTLVVDIVLSRFYADSSP